MSLSEIYGGLYPGKSVRISGVAGCYSDRFMINFQSGSDMSATEIPFHISVRLNQGYIARNNMKFGGWQSEEGYGGLPIRKGGYFDIVVNVTTSGYTVFINGQYFCNFLHKMPYEIVTHLYIHGDVSINSVTFEGSPNPYPPPGPGCVTTITEYSYPNVYHAPNMLDSPCHYHHSHSYY